MFDGPIYRILGSLRSNLYGAMMITSRKTDECGRINAVVGAAMLVLLLVLGACSSNPVMVKQVPELSGVWTNALLSPEDSRWRIEDLACARTGCSLAGFNYLQSLLTDTNNES